MIVGGSSTLSSRFHVTLSHYTVIRRLGNNVVTKSIAMALLLMQLFILVFVIFIVPIMVLGYHKAS